MQSMKKEREKREREKENSLAFNVAAAVDGAVW